MFAATSTIPGKSITTSGGVQRVVGPGWTVDNVFFLEVDENFLPTYDIPLIAGKNFSDKASAVSTANTK